VIQYKFQSVSTGMYPQTLRDCNNNDYTLTSPDQAKPPLPSSLLSLSIPIPLLKVQPHWALNASTIPPGFLQNDFLFQHSLQNLRIGREWRLTAQHERRRRRVRIGMSSLTHTQTEIIVGRRHMIIMLYQCLRPQPGLEDRLWWKRWRAWEEEAR
jgi:hypothetical protein